MKKLLFILASCGITTSYAYDAANFYLDNNTKSQTLYAQWKAIDLDSSCDDNLNVDKGGVFKSSPGQQHIQDNITVGKYDQSCKYQLNIYDANNTLVATEDYKVVAVPEIITHTPKPKAAVFISHTIKYCNSNFHCQDNDYNGKVNYNYGSNHVSINIRDK
jgi:hypothetical protein